MRFKATCPSEALTILPASSTHCALDIFHQEQQNYIKRVYLHAQALAFKTSGDKQLKYFNICSVSGVKSVKISENKKYRQFNLLSHQGIIILALPKLQLFLNLI